MTRTYAPGSAGEDTSRYVIGERKAISGPLPLGVRRPTRINFPVRATMIADAYPDVIGAHDAAILRREEAFRTRELADLLDENEAW